jgi:polyisoprenoid-binding protein YceI
LALRATSAAAQTPSEVYSLSQAGSLVSFTIYGKALFQSIKREGRFKQFDGELAYDPTNPSGTHVDLTVYTASVDINDTDQNQMLRSRNFFDVDHFPTMHFTGAVANVRPDGTMTVDGDLTIRGITKRISTPVRFRSAGANPGVFETTFQIDRTEFGLNGVPTWGGINVSISKKVQIHLAIAATQSTFTQTR